jgi:hypothetical protein
MPEEDLHLSVMAPLQAHARRRLWPAFKATLELRTRTRQNHVALVFSIPVCPSPRGARSGQPGFFSAISAISA